MNQEKNLNKNANDTEIATEAYYLWESDGRPAGRDVEYWIKAKEKLSGRSSARQGNESASTQGDQTDTAQNGEKQQKKKKTENRAPSAKQHAFA